MKNIFFSMIQIKSTTKIKSALIKIICLTAVVSISGCAFYSNLNSRSTNVDMTQNGIVIISLQESSPSRKSESVSYSFENVADQTRGSFSIGGLFFSDYDFLIPRGRGDVFAVALPPGQYTLTGWSISAGNAHIYPREYLPAYFNVEKGKAIYLGNIDMQLETGRNFLGIQMVFGGVPFIQDQMERDIPLAIKKFSFLGSMNIEKSILEYEQQSIAN
jgi:hypothetical protein